MAEKRCFGKGEVIFKEGDKEYEFSQIISGKVGIYRDYGSKYEKKLTERVEGDIIGEMGVIDYRRRSATAIALDYTELNVYSDAEFDEFLAHNPDKMFEILDTMVNRIRELSKDNEQIRRDIMMYASTEEADLEPSLLDRITKIVKSIKRG